MPKAIRTKYTPRTEHRPDFIRASDSDGNALKVPWDKVSHLGTEGAHEAVALALAHKLNWKGRWVGGGDGSRGYVFVDVTGAKPQRPRAL